jgi:SAM-dependent methyltransferase
LSIAISERETIGAWQLAGYPSCIVCGGNSLSELVGSKDLAVEAVQRERLFRGLFPPETPGYMLKDRAYATQTYNARLLMCDECGTLARDPHLSARGSVASYTRDAYHPSWMESSYREFRAAFADRMPELVRWVGPHARVLEVGSFVGGFLAAAEAHGWRAQGVDVGECVTEFARDKGHDVRTGRLVDTAFSDRSFDAVFVWSCFDQLPEPWEDLEEIHRILKPDGRLLIRVPNGEFVKRMQRLERWVSSDAVRESVRKILAFAGLAAFPFQIGYTPSSLGGMLRESGFGSVHVRNRINVRGFDPRRRSFWTIPSATTLLRCVHAGSEILGHATFGALRWGPWIEVSCSKSRRTLASDTLLACCFA